MNKKSKLSFVLLCALVISLCLGIGGISFASEISVPVQDWVSHNENGTISRNINGITMGSDAEAGTDYGFSFTSQKKYALNGLSMTMRIKDAICSENNAAAFVIGFVDDSATDIMAEEGSYGVLLAANNNGGYYAWFVRRDSAQTALPGFESIEGGDSISLSVTNSLTISLLKEGSKWTVSLNGSIINIEDAGVVEELDEIEEAHLSIAAADYLDSEKNGLQKMKLDLYQVGKDILGFKNDISTVHARGNGATATIGEDGIYYGTTSAENGQKIDGVVVEDLKGKLDGFTFSVTFNFNELNRYVFDFGIGTYHEPGRFTFWDSMNDNVNVISSFGLRVNSDMGVFFLTIPNGEVSDIKIIQGNSYVKPADNNYVLQLNKVGENWNIYMNGRKMVAGNENFQSRINATMEALNSASGVSPWFLLGDFGFPTGNNSYSVGVTVNGYGTRAVGKISDPDNGVIGDEIDGKLEFAKSQWTNFAPSESQVDYKVDEEGFSIAGMNKVSGFNAGLNYTVDLGDIAANSFTVTLKMPEKVLASGGPVHGYYGIFIGEVTNKNFADQKSLYIRWQYSSDNPASGATADVIIWDVNDPSRVLAASSNSFPAKSEEGRQTEVTIRIVKNPTFYQNRVYINGKRISNSGVESILGSFLDSMESKYFYTMCSYEKDGVGSAWPEDATEKMNYHLVSINGRKIVNEAPEEVLGITLGDATDITENSAKLTWTKAEYPEGEIDSYNFVPVGYIIERIKGSATTPETTITVEGDIDTLTYTDTGLEAGTDYYYTVYAVDKDGNKLIRSNKNKRVITLSAEEPGGEQPEESKKPTDSGEGCGCSGRFELMGILTASLILLSCVLLFKRRRQE